VISELLTVFQVELILTSECKAFQFRLAQNRGAKLLVNQDTGLLLWVLPAQQST
jgi:hypothetical protein